MKNLWTQGITTRISLNPQNSQEKKVCTPEILTKAQWHRPTRPTKFSALYKESLEKQTDLRMVHKSQQRALLATTVFQMRVFVTTLKLSDKGKATNFTKGNFNIIITCKMHSFV